MNDLYTNINPSNVPDMDHHSFFMMAELPFKESKEQVWEILEEKLTEKPKAKFIPFSINRMVMAAAAVLVLLLGTFLVMRFYTVSAVTSYGSQLAISLPDGSRVEMNAGSEIAYHPLWWKVSRIVRFEGEGYFEVEKGRKFQVRSTKGTTSVLGTSFTVYSRTDEYRVACHTGSVKVSSTTDQEVILSPEYEAVINPDGHILVSRENNLKNTTSWIKGMFTFEARPLRLVLDEIERQYDVRIEFQTAKEYLYSGYFSKDKPVVEVMELVCKPFGLKFAERSETSFEIIQN